MISSISKYVAAMMLVMSTVPALSAGWKATPLPVTKYWVGTYGEGDALVFDTSDNARYYFNLTGTELSRQMAASIMAAYFKAKKVNLFVTDHALPGTNWMMVTNVGPTN